MGKSSGVVRSTVSTVPSRVWDDTTLWQSFRKGDRTAFEHILESHYTLLLKYGIRICNDKEFVKDCLHDLFVDLWNRREQLEEIRNLKSYLLVSFRRKVLKESHKLRWFREAGEVTEDYTFEVQFTIEAYLINNEVQHESLLRLKNSLEKLTKRQREVIYLRFYQEMDYDEIADSLGINYHSVVNLMYEGMKLLRKNWFLALLTTCTFFS
ncbi:RNA polymerase sigma factor [Salmonirosea aquatica]|uniref:Sigma-70 family RNA polymerase sigma factor n=1 Tax=Salmonirosea aquatica TaxID=2654236 RepID=A0A7C9FZJ2_9BACT|nr:sigma-70 family RNA polymerase sigma factor [Cytophagaceae bacterium SJW1-29]